MSSVKYTRLLNHDYDGRGSGDNYRSIFTYNRLGDDRSAQITAVREQQPNLGHRIILFCFATLGFIFFILTLPFAGWFAFKMVPEHKRLVVFRLGRRRGVLGPGFTFLLPLLDSAIWVDVSPRSFSVPPSRAYTQDGAVVEVGANITFHISDPQLSVMTMQDTNSSLRAISQSTLLHHLAGLKLSELQSTMMSVNKYVQMELSRAVKQWGISISRVEVSPPRLLYMLPEQDALKDIKFVLSALFKRPSGHEPTERLQQQQQQQQQWRQQQQQQDQQLAAPEHQLRTTTWGSEFTPDVTTDDVINRVLSLVNVDVVRSVGAMYEFDLLGPGGGTYYLDLKHGCGSAGKGKPPIGQADVVISLPAADLQGFLDGSVNALHAYLSGQIAVSGDLQLAARLSSLASSLK